MKITPAALRHAQKVRAHVTRNGRPRSSDVDEELGDIFGDLLGGLPLIGGLFGGGKAAPAAPPPAAAAAMGPAPGMMGMPMPGGGPTLEQIRAIVQDALSGNRDIVERMALTQAGTGSSLAKATDAVTAAIAPQLAAARGGVQVQRLQTQASSEHRGLTAQADRERLGTARHAELVSRLDRIAAAANNVQNRLGGSPLGNPHARAILNIR